MIKVSDYIAKYLVSHGITDGFTVVGGGAMHLNDSFGHEKGLHMYYNHHEQASSIAAEAYARYENKPALLCVTTGPGGINALNGVAMAYLDSLPMLVISGQVRYDKTSEFAKSYGAEIRSFGDQEFNIVDTVKTMTKYSYLVKDKSEIKKCLDEAFDKMLSGRMGPVWLDVPLDIQGAYIDEKDDRERAKVKETYVDIKSRDFECEVYSPDKQNSFEKISLSNVVEHLIDLIKKSNRPVIYAGYGIRLSGAYGEFKKLIEKLSIPIVTYWNAIDLMETDSPLYVGRGGTMGDRAGNFAVQNSDLIISIGSRMSIRQVGFDKESFAPKAKLVMIDIDENEFKKPNLKLYKGIKCDAKIFIEAFSSIIDDEKVAFEKKEIISKETNEKTTWNEVCQRWKEKYKVAGIDKYEQKELVNVYAFIDYLSKSLKEESLTVVSNGACCVAGSQTFVIKKGTRFHNNNAIASMGYGLPASIGACISIGKKETICLEGDGSIMMNLQELQTVLTNKLPIKIFLINNSGYQSIRITQTNLFSEHTKVGIGPDSNDLSFPNYEKIAEAFGYKYLKATNNEEMKKVVDKALGLDGPLFVEIFTDTKQVFEPKNSSKKLSDGSIVSAPLHDMAPFLDRAEIEKNLYID